MYNNTIPIINIDNIRFSYPYYYYFEPSHKIRKIQSDLSPDLLDKIEKLIKEWKGGK